jgi:hypothetical protein
MFYLLLALEMNGRHVESAEYPLIVKLAEVRRRSDSMEFGASHAEIGHLTVHSSLEDECGMASPTSPPAFTPFFGSTSIGFTKPYSHWDFNTYKCVQMSPSHWINNAAYFPADTLIPSSIFRSMPTFIPATATANLRSEGTRTIGVVLDRRDTASNIMAVLWDTLSQFGEVLSMSVDTARVHPTPPADGALVLVQMKSQPQALAAARALNGSLLMSCCGPVSMQVTLVYKCTFLTY